MSDRSGAPMIAIEHASARFGRARPAVDDVTIEIARGETVALLGPSGCGKSTLLRLLVGLLAPTSGSVRVDGVDPRGKDGRWLKHRLGYVIQEGGLFPHLTARANVTLLAEHLKRPRHVIDARVDELAALVQLSADVLARHPAQLSGGERQRTALMRALMLDPDVLLLDEPLGALDPIVRADLQDALAAIFKKLRKTVLLVTHDLVEAALFAPRMVLLHDGHVVADGSLAALRSSSEPFAQRFVSAHRALPTNDAGSSAESRT